MVGARRASMRRISGAVFILLLAALPAAARFDAAKPAAPLSEPTSVKRGEGSVRLAAAAARKRATTSDAPARDAATPLAERIAIQFDLAWTGDYNGLVNGEEIGRASCREGGGRAGG